MSPSTELLTCESCRDALAAYIEDEVAGVDVARRYPAVARHLASCPDCRQQHDLWYELMLQEAAGEFGDAPVYATFAEQARRAAPPAMPWTQPMRDLYRLAAAIPVRIGRGAAAFGVLVPPLTVRLAPVPLYRGPRPAAEETRGFVELLELPHIEANVTFKVSLGPVSEGQASLALAVQALAPAQPIAQARVALREADGGLLEGAFTDADGVVLFRDLEVGEYLIRVEHAGKAWEFPLSFAPA